MQAKIGDTVRFLNAVGGGKLVRIEGQMAYVDEDGFETPVLLRECVPVASESSFVKPPEATVMPQAAMPQSKAQPDPEPELPFVETPEGEKINIVLGFEPANIHKISDGDIFAYLVNDSNYYLYVCFATRPDSSSDWTVRYAGVIEPSMQVMCGEFHHDDLPLLEEASVQYFSFKKHGDFRLKPVGDIRLKLDPVKFVKLHCFKSNPYFEGPVVAYNITVDDVPQRQIRIDPDELAEAMKKDTEPPLRRPVKKHHIDSKNETLVVDLHAAELLDDLRGLSNADILNYQIDKFREVMDANLRQRGKKIVFIHGKGEGVLRSALMKEFTHRYKGHEVQDASFREYGYGATQVTIVTHQGEGRKGGR